MLPKIRELWQKQKQRIAEAAGPYLKPGETVRFVILAQTRLPNWLAPVPFGVIYGVRKRVIIVTDQNVSVLAMPMLSPTNVSGLVVQHPLRSSGLRLGSMGAIYVGQLRLWLFPMAKELKRAEVDGALEMCRSAN
jgi:hypothetical protein